MTAALFHLWLSAESADDRSLSRVVRVSQDHASGTRSASDRAALFLEPELVARVRAGDVTAFETLTTLALEPLIRFANSFVHASDVAEDIAQDVLVRVWSLGDAWRPTGSAAAYLLASVRNEARKAIRRQHLEAKHASQVQETWIPDETATRLLGPDELLVWHERMRAFNAVLDELTERQRSAFVLRYEQGLTVPAVAEVLGISTKGAEKLVARVTHLLRDRLRDIR